MKKIFLIICCLLTCLTVYPKPKHHSHHHLSRPAIHHRHGPYKHHSHHSHHHTHCGSFIAGAVVGGLVTTLLTPSQPVVVTTPTPVIVQQPQQVWVPGKWIITYDNHGRQIKTWQPGYWTTVIQ